MARCCEELTISNFYVSIFLEGLGAAFLVYITGSMLTRADVASGNYVIESAFVIGLTLAVLTQCLKDVSGSHMNPAITFASMFTRRVSIIRGICYIIFQCGGGILGALALRELEEKSKEHHLAMTILSPNITLAKGVGYEMIFTFLYTWVFYTSKTYKDTFKGFGGPLAVGLVYGISHVIILKYTGCSLNPARSLGPAVLEQVYKDQWIYAAGPILAACFAGLLHDFIFQRTRNTMYPRPRSCSITCCKPSREEAILTEFSQYVDEPKYYRDIIVKKPEETV